MSSCPLPSPPHDINLRFTHPLLSFARATPTYLSIRCCIRPPKLKRNLQNSIDDERRRSISGTHNLVFLSPSTVSLFSSSLQSDHHLLDEIPERTVPLYASLIGSLVKSHQWRDALSVFFSMVGEDLKPDKFLLPKVLKACAELESLRFGTVVHGYMLKQWEKLRIDAFVGNSLVDMYGKCGDLLSARKVFEGMPEKDVVSWTALLMAYTSSGLVKEAKEIFNAMREKGIRPDLISWNSLISAFAKEGDRDSVLGLLEDMKVSGLEPGINSWNGILSGLVQNGCYEDALGVFSEIILVCSPNAVSIASLLPACSALKFLAFGRALHSYAIKNSFASGNVFVSGSLIDMYMKCGDRKAAEMVFKLMDTRTETVWNEMISGWANWGELEKALEFMKMMMDDGLMPDVITYNTVLAAFARNGKKDEAFRLVSEMGETGLKPNIVSVNALISGFQQRGLNEEALGLLQVLVCRFEDTNLGKPNIVMGFPAEMLGSSVKLNAVTLTSVLAACSSLKLRRSGEEIHGFMLRSGLESNVFVSSALLDMYAKCGRMDSAVKVFNGAREINTVTWNTMISGYNSSGEPQNALKLFSEMLSEGHAVSAITILILLQACSTMESLSLGRALHGYALKIKNENFGLLDSALVDMYAKCGNIQDARVVFNAADEKDLALWNAMISGYALHGMAEDSISVFSLMEKSGISPDHITFTSILSACRQDGFMDVGWKYFNMMEDVYNVKHDLEHYTCMVSIMGNAGLLEEALNFIQRMPVEPDACIWASLLLACRAQADYRIGQLAASALFELEPKNPSNYTILSNIYAMVGLWESAMHVRHLMRVRGLKPSMTCSWINVRHRAHVFEAGNSVHLEMDGVLEEWDRLAVEMESLGYFPQDPCIDEEPDPFSCFHTEKLAICYGLISLPSKVPVHVSKNARLCIDCHTSAKFISMIEDRELVVRDSGCFHKFIGGVCSCGDKW